VLAIELVALVVARVVVEVDLFPGFHSVTALAGALLELALVLVLMAVETLLVLYPGIACVGMALCALDCLMLALKLIPLVIGRVMVEVYLLPPFDRMAALA